MKTPQIAAESPGRNTDDEEVYKIFFNTIKLGNETLQDHLRFLPGVQSGESQRIINEAAAPSAFTRVTSSKGALGLLPSVPVVPDLTQEWRDALDPDDLSTESGDWVDAISKPEEVDEDGVALLPLNNDASTSILDAPGDLRVDNFCVEAGDSAEGSLGGPTSSNTAVGSKRPMTYTPSALDGAASHRAAPAGMRTKPNQRAAAPQCTALPAGPVVTLEDEVRKMRLGQAQAGGQSIAAATACPSACHAPAAPVAGVCRPRQGTETRAEFAKPACAGPLPVGSLPLGECSSSLLADAEDDQAEPLTPPGAHDNVQLRASAYDGQPGSMRAHQPEVDLPGLCLLVTPQADEAAVAADQLLHAMEVEAGGMVQALGLASKEEQGALPRGTDDADTPRGSEVPHTQQQTAQQSGSSSSCAHPPGPVASCQGSSDASAASAASGVQGQESHDHCQAVSYEEVQEFSLDPGFDYDNCPLTEREWPYNRLARPMPFKM